MKALTYYVPQQRVEDWYLHRYWKNWLRRKNGKLRILSAGEGVLQYFTGKRLGIFEKNIWLLVVFLHKLVTRTQIPFIILQRRTSTSDYFVLRLHIRTIVVQTNQFGCIHPTIWLASFQHHEYYFPPNYVVSRRDHTVSPVYIQN